MLFLILTFMQDHSLLQCFIECKYV